MAKETTVWIKPLDLPWEQVGTGVFQGITPENINLEADTWGPSNATFDLRREPDAPALDLSAGAEVEVRVAGVNVWDGFVSSTPKKRGDLVVSVVCRGWQDELDGRIFTAGYVHTSLADFKDARSFPNAPLNYYLANGVVRTDGGSPLIGFPKDAVVTTAFSCAGIILDLGPGLTAKRIVVEFANEGIAAGTYTVSVASADSPYATIYGPASGAVAFDPASASSPQAGTCSTPYRYVVIYVQRTPGGTVTETIDRLVRITSVKVFTDTAYESGGASILKASTVVKDALAKGTLALSSDLSGIDATSFNIPDLWPDPKGVTARELISKVNAYHNWTAKLEPGRRFIFTARSTVPKVKVGEWSALPDDEDASANDITDIYNHCRATSTEPGGTLVVVDRYSTNQVTVPASPAPSPRLPNPDFESSADGWTNMVRTTTAGEFTTGTAGGKNTTGTASVAAFSGKFIAGIPYTITFDAKLAAGANYDIALGVAITHGGGTAVNSLNFTISATFAGYSGTFTPTHSGTGVLTVSMSPSTTKPFYIDDIKVLTPLPTVLDKRGRVRSMVLDASAALPADGVALTQLADTWLAAHMTTPFKGKQSIQGAASIRDYLNGDNVAPERLLGMTTDLLHFDDRLNPDTGDVGRDGRLVKVSYQPLTDTVQTDVDSTRSDFGALLSRIGVLASS